jgi:hypothetical protein
MKSFPKGLYIALYLMALMLAVPVSAGVTAKNEASQPAVKREIPGHKTYMKRTWGVEVLWVREASAGYMLEFRYKVLDAEKAKPLFVRQTKPELIDEKTGGRIGVPAPAKIGALRNSDMPVGGKTYWMFFANPGRSIKPGDAVSIQIGDYLQEHLIVKK